jgi:putative transposase
LSDSAKDVVLSSFHFHNNKKYHLRACVVMDDHAHCILQPVEIKNNSQARRLVPPGTPVQPHEYHSLAQITHSIKSYSSNRIHKLLNRKGRIWQDENYDRIIRDEKEYLEKMNYITNNPVKAGFVEASENYKWLFVAVID